MAEVETFSKDLIENYLKGKGLKYLVDNEGDYLVQFDYDDRIGCSMMVWLIQAGSAQEIYKVLVLTDRRIPRSEWGRVILLCNKWNRDKRYPKAYLYIKDPDNDLTASIHLEQNIDLQTGIHQALFDDFTDTIRSASFYFWEWVHSEHGL